MSILKHRTTAFKLLASFVLINLGLHCLTTFISVLPIDFQVTEIFIVSVGLLGLLFLVMAAFPTNYTAYSDQFFDFLRRNTRPDSFGRHNYVGQSQS